MRNMIKRITPHLEKLVATGSRSESDRNRLERSVVVLVRRKEAGIKNLRSVISHYLLLNSAREICSDTKTVLARMSNQPKARIMRVQLSLTI